MKYFTSIKFGLISLVISSLSANAQITQTIRYEAASVSDKENFNVTSLGSSGILLHRQINTENFGNIELVKLDSSLQEIWQGYIPIDYAYSISHYRMFNNKFTVLLKTTNLIDFQLLSIDERTGVYYQYSFRSYIPFSPSEFEVNENAVIIGGYYNRVPIVICYNLTTLNVKILPGLFSEIGELNQIKMYDDNTFDVLLNARYFNREKTIWIKSYSANGDFIKQVALPVEDNRNLLFGRIHKTSSDVKVVAGVFGNRNSEYSKGLFVSTLNPSNKAHLRYYNFSELDNFFSYMKKKKEIRIKERIERRKTKGKISRFNYRLLVHELLPYQDQLIFLGEVFYPKYKSASRNSFGAYSYPMGPAMYGNELVFDGYKYTHATILGFDTKGNLLWDNTFEINDVKTFTKEQFVKIKSSGNKLNLVYLFNNQLRSKIINEDKVVEGKSIEAIKTFYQGDIDEKTESSSTKLEYWYNEYMFAYGVQSITNVSQTGLQIQRNVFFINKLKCN